MLRKRQSYSEVREENYKNKEHKESWQSKSLEMTEDRKESQCDKSAMNQWDSRGRKVEDAYKD